MWCFWSTAVWVFLKILRVISCLKTSDFIAGYGIWRVASPVLLLGIFSNSRTLVFILYAIAVQSSWLPEITLDQMLLFVFTFEKHRVWSVFVVGICSRNLLLLGKPEHYSRNIFIYAYSIILTIIGQSSSICFGEGIGSVQLLIVMLNLSFNFFLIGQNKLQFIVLLIGLSFS